LLVVREGCSSHCARCVCAGGSQPFRQVHSLNLESHHHSSFAHVLTISIIIVIITAIDRYYHRRSSILDASNRSHVWWGFSYIFLVCVCVFSKLRHPNIVLFLGACFTPGHYMMVTELMPRGSLFDLLKENKDISFKKKMKMVWWLALLLPPLLLLGLLVLDLTQSGCNALGQGCSSGNELASLLKTSIHPS
jgi:hypothetical protein